jgi:hypothetical protein
LAHVCPFGARSVPVQLTETRERHRVEIGLRERLG